MDEMIDIFGLDDPVQTMRGLTKEERRIKMQQHDYSARGSGELALRRNFEKFPDLYGVETETEQIPQPGCSSD